MSMGDLLVYFQNNGFIIQRKFDVYYLMKKNFRSKTIITSAALLLSAASFAQTNGTAPKDSLYTNFQNPGKAARPRVWWHWMNGNITKDGIQKDLLWMK